MATVADFDSGLRVSSPIAPRNTPAGRELERGQTRSGLASRSETSPEIAEWSCLIVAGTATRRDLLGQAVGQGGWQANRASRIDIAVRMATQRRMRLAIVELGGNDDDSGLEDLAVQIARAGGLLVVLSTGAGSVHEEIRVRQLGPWLYGAGEISGEELASLSADAKRLLCGKGA